MMNDRVNQVITRFKGGMSCSQSILSTYGPLYGLSQDDAVKVARGFGGGMARLSEACGAVTGSFMALGLVCPGTDKQAKEDTCFCLIGARTVQRLLIAAKQFYRSNEKGRPVGRPELCSSNLICR